MTHNNEYTSFKETTFQEQYCSFKLDGKLYAFNIHDVKEITTEPRLTPIHHAPDFIFGYVNIRGQIHMILDLKFLLGFGKYRYDENSKVILFKQKIGESMGVIVENVQNVINVDQRKIDERQKDEIAIDKETRGHPCQSELVHGIYKMPHSLMIILKADKLFSVGRHYMQS